MAKQLPTTHINGKTYSVDERLHELRNADNPNDVIRLKTADDFAVYLYWTEQLEKTVGKRVVAAQMEWFDFWANSEWAPVIAFEDGSELVILRDEEGNGAGRFEILLKDR